MPSVISWLVSSILQALVEGSIQVADLPQLWNQTMKEYLGCEPESDARGVLQVRGGACPVPWAY